MFYLVKGKPRAAERRWVWLFLDPGGVAACSRWLSAFCETTGTRFHNFAPRQGASRCKSRRWHLSGCGIFGLFPVVSQTTLNHRLHAATLRGQNPDVSPTSRRLVHHTKPEKWAVTPPAIPPCRKMSFERPNPEPASGRPNTAQDEAIRLREAEPWVPENDEASHEVGARRVREVLMTGVITLRRFVRFWIVTQGFAACFALLHSASPMGFIRPRVAGLVLQSMVWHCLLTRSSTGGIPPGNPDSKWARETINPAVPRT